ncbi:hypothetical protein DFJ73DRAFT_793553 [Zopfochytrium polystomum]|nr:hypothetical protein DFJ73DRAFT_793553 [Zopfochytrium polystomum]
MASTVCTDDGVALSAELAALMATVAMHTHRVSLCKRRRPPAARNGGLPGSVAGVGVSTDISCGTSGDAAPSPLLPPPPAPQHPLQSAELLDHIFSFLHNPTHAHTHHHLAPALSVNTLWHAVGTRRLWGGLRFVHSLARFARFARDFVDLDHPQTRLRYLVLRKRALWCEKGPEAFLREMVRDVDETVVWWAAGVLADEEEAAAAAEAVGGDGRGGGGGDGGGDGGMGLGSPAAVDSGTTAASGGRFWLRSEATRPSTSWDVAMELGRRLLLRAVMGFCDDDDESAVERGGSGQRDGVGYARFAEAAAAAALDSLRKRRGSCGSGGAVKLIEPSPPPPVECEITVVPTYAFGGKKFICKSTAPPSSSSAASQRPTPGSRNSTPSSSYSTSSAYSTGATPQDHRAHRPRIDTAFVLELVRSLSPQVLVSTLPLASRPSPPLAPRLVHAPALRALHLHAIQGLTDALLVPVLEGLPSLVWLSVFHCYDISDKSVHAAVVSCKRLAHVRTVGCKKISDASAITLALYGAKTLVTWDASECPLISELGVERVFGRCRRLASLGVGRFGVDVRQQGQPPDLVAAALVRGAEKVKEVGHNEYDEGVADENEEAEEDADGLVAVDEAADTPPRVLRELSLSGWAVTDAGMRLLLEPPEAAASAGSSAAREGHAAAQIGILSRVRRLAVNFCPITEASIRLIEEMCKDIKVLEIKVDRIGSGQTVVLPVDTDRPSLNILSRFLGRLQHALGRSYSSKSFWVGGITFLASQGGPAAARLATLHSRPTVARPSRR